MSIIPEWMISLLQSMHITGMDCMDDGTIRVMRWCAPHGSITTVRVHDASEWDNPAKADDAGIIRA